MSRGVGGGHDFLVIALFEGGRWGRYFASLVRSDFSWDLLVRAGENLPLEIPYMSTSGEPEVWFHTHKLSCLRFSFGVYQNDEVER